MGGLGGGPAAPLHRRRLQRRWWRGLRWRQRRRRIRWPPASGAFPLAQPVTASFPPRPGGVEAGGAQVGLNQIRAAGVQAGDGEVMITELAPAVPEPSTWAMSLAGFAALAFARGFAGRRSPSRFGLAAFAGVTGPFQRGRDLLCPLHVDTAVFTLLSSRSTAQTPGSENGD